MKAYDARPGEQVSLLEAGREGIFVIKSGVPATDPQEGVYVPLANGNYAKRVMEDEAHFSWFGGVADGATNETAVVSDFLSFCEVNKVAAIFPAGVIMIDPDQIAIGNGTTAGISTLNGQRIYGAGHWTYKEEGCTIFRAASAGNEMLSFNGVSSITVKGVSLDCDGLVGVGYRLMSVNTSIFEGFSAQNFKNYGMILSCFAGVSDQAFWSATNKFSEFFLTSNQCNTYAAGLYLDGDINGPYDPHRNTFIGGICQLGAVSETDPVYGADFRFCDSNTFIECDFGVYAAPNLGYGIHFSDSSNPGDPYPQNNNFVSCSLSGGGPSGTVGGVAVDEVDPIGIGENMFIAYPTADAEPIPTHVKLLGYTSRLEYFSDPTYVGAFRTVNFKTDASEYRILHNASDSSASGLNIEKFDGASWVPMFSIDNSGSTFINIPGIGFKEVMAGGVDTGGNGFRRLVVPN